MYDEAIQYLEHADPVLAAVIARVGPCRATLRREGTHFDALMRSIVYQQLSGKAAGTIHARVLALYGGRPPAPAELLATPDAALRAAGLSRQKLAYLRDLATHVESGSVLLDDAAIDALGDEEIIARLTHVKGIGRWTVQMFLMFRLGRPDVLPELDLGIQNAIRRAYRMRRQPGPKDVRRIGRKWSPHSTVACWYLWRSLEQPGGIVTGGATKRTAARKTAVRKTAPRKQGRTGERRS
ncbi:MAG TPA: DNA-3-methyladenine glycosylase [Gemmatimonadaceae bacterium]|nr:DNA-3-methyladenine glycosylase [Gemmatimonadaceae bacterium]